MTVGIVDERVVDLVRGAVGLKLHSLYATVIDQSYTNATVVRQRKEGVRPYVHIRQRIAVTKIALLGVCAGCIVEACAYSQTSPCSPADGSIYAECLHALVAGIVVCFLNEVKRLQIHCRHKHAAGSI